MKRKPFKFSEWIKHSYDFEENVSPIKVVNNEVLVTAHPAHPKVKLDMDKNIVEQVYELPKSLQLYFFGLVWAGFCNFEDNNESSAVEKILLSIFDYADINPKLHKKEMIWDDHALSERACVLVYFKQYDTLVSEKIVGRIDDHLKMLIENLDVLLSSKKWEGNNHRIFHLCAKWCIEKYYVNDFDKAKFYIDEIENFFFKLIDCETGLSVEQSVSYYNFDIILLKMVSRYLEVAGESFKDNRLEFRKIEQNKNMHIKALAFPDGQLPASGDTPLGLKIPFPSLKRCEREQLWKSLENIGHYRGCSQDEKFHYHVLSHNAESAHGHHSPLHIDLWVKDFGMVLVDSGGPYKYGDPLRYKWFRAYEGHNTISFSSTSSVSKCLVDVSDERGSLRGSFNSGESKLSRKLEAEPNSFSVYDSVDADDNWVSHLHFDPSLEVNIQDDILYLSRENQSLIVQVESSEQVKISLDKGYVTTKGGAKTCSACVFFSGPLGKHKLSMKFKL